LIGFNSEDGVDETPSQHSEVLAQVQPDDLVHYGMIPEMVGRLPSITSLAQLDKEAMVRILTEPKNALLRQYKQLFQIEETTLEVDDDALQAIASKALQRDVGARALRSVMEEMMLDLMYDLPENKEEGAVYAITREMVEGDDKPSLFAARHGSVIRKKARNGRFHHRERKSFQLSPLPVSAPVQPQLLCGAPGSSHPGDSNCRGQACPPYGGGFRDESSGLKTVPGNDFHSNFRGRALPS